jgi:hypothetical protein
MIMTGLKTSSFEIDRFTVIPRDITTVRLDHVRWITNFPSQMVEEGKAEIFRRTA